MSVFSFSWELQQQTLKSSKAASFGVQVPEVGAFPTEEAGEVVAEAGEVADRHSLEDFIVDGAGKPWKA